MGEEPSSARFSRSLRMSACQSGDGMTPGVRQRSAQSCSSIWSFSAVVIRSRGNADSMICSTARAWAHNPTEVERRRSAASLSKNGSGRGDRSGGHGSAEPPAGTESGWECQGAPSLLFSSPLHLTARSLDGPRTADIHAAHSETMHWNRTMTGCGRKAISLRSRGSGNEISCRPGSNFR